ncbi:hypothetical protein SAY86_014921 [Trapa natans]|uniref:Uncharacterized protein n=1 Tax=Trapa natans TaxID=22666 RepID=A0AAN7KHC7_TRANT|nr:hypothetical protein SAY86_014921 [Trapa natans]
MEKSKLNFNTPLISVRRISASGSSNLDSFLIDRRRTTPPYKTCSNVEQVTEPVNVPFMWEQIPGIAKNQPDPQDPDEVRENVSVDQALTELLRSLEGSTRGDGDETEETDFLDYSDDNDNEVHSDSDAPESFSAESVSFSFDYSVSGLSGSDGSARKPCGMFSVDLTTRDLILSRFLPAARAMALEPPLFACHRQQLPVVEVKREPVRDTTRTLPGKGESDMIKKYHKHCLGEGGKSRDEIDEADDDYGIIQGKGCGLIPKLSLKGSLCLLNPIPGLKVRAKSSLAVPSPAKRSCKDGLSEDKTKPVPKDGGSGLLNFSGEQQIMRSSLSPFRRSNFSGEQQVQRSSLSPFRRSNFSGEQQVLRSSLSPFRRSNFSGELQIMRGSLSPFRSSRADALLSRQNVHDQKQHPEPASLTPKLPSLTPKPPHFNYSGELRPTRSFLSPQMLHQNMGRERRLHDAFIPRLRDYTAKPPAGGGSRCFNLSGELLQDMRNSAFPYRHSTTRTFSIRKNERPSSPSDRVTVLGSYKEVEFSTTGNSSVESRNDGLMQTSFGVEKTMYVDSISNARDSHTNSKSWKQEVWMEPEAKEEDESPRRRTPGLKEASSERPGPQEFFKPPRYRRSSKSGDLTQSKAASLKGVEKGDLSCESLPPLLKSPSQSWLYGTLPSGGGGGGPFTPKMQSPSPMMISTHETKWETIVRSSNSHHDHVRYSEELIPRATGKAK